MEPRSTQTLVGERLRMRREYLNWSQQDLAQRLGIDQSAVSRLEHGTARMDMTLACMAADQLGLRRSYLFARDFAEAFRTLLGLVWQEVVAFSDGEPMQRAVQTAREELHALDPQVVGVSLFLETDQTPVFRFWTTSQFRFASGVWDPRQGLDQRIGKLEQAYALLEAWRERRVLERRNPAFLSEGQRHPRDPYHPAYVIDIPLERSMFGVGFQREPSQDPRWWIREVGQILEVGALRAPATAQPAEVRLPPNGRNERAG